MAGYVYTNENCIGCNRCISVCPVLTANQAVRTGSRALRSTMHSASTVVHALMPANIRRGNMPMIRSSFLRICREANPFHCFWRRHFWRIIPESMSRF